MGLYLSDLRSAKFISVIDDYYHIADKEILNDSEYCF